MKVNLILEFYDEDNMFLLPEVVEKDAESQNK